MLLRQSRIKCFNAFIQCYKTSALAPQLLSHRSNLHSHCTRELPRIYTHLFNARFLLTSCQIKQSWTRFCSSSECTCVLLCLCRRWFFSCDNEHITNFTTPYHMCRALNTKLYLFLSLSLCSNYFERYGNFFYKMCISDINVTIVNHETVAFRVYFVFTYHPSEYLICRQSDHLFLNQKLPTLWILNSFNESIVTLQTIEGIGDEKFLFNFNGWILDRVYLSVSLCSDVLWWFWFESFLSERNNQIRYTHENGEENKNSFSSDLLPNQFWYSPFLCVPSWFTHSIRTLTLIYRVEIYKRIRM